jgi:hypothetical protein
MKTKQKWVWQLMAALALATVVGCASDQNRGGDNAAYQQGYGYQQQQPNDWTNPGPPYEQQHTSPRQQMTP